MTVVDKAVLVTGANRGIGQALVEEALRRGAARVYAGTRQFLVHPDERVTPLILDVTNAAEIRRAADSVESLDILINNESPMDVKRQFGVDGDAARHDMKGPLEMSRTDSY
jgi:NAD(P)-dependent dehydrogenase (short-subunit alcohol dehydrogenase family)